MLFYLDSSRLHDELVVKNHSVEKLCMQNSIRYIIDACMTHNTTLQGTMFTCAVLHVVLFG